MARLKYSKYFLNELPDEQRFKGFGKMPAMVAYTDGDILEGSKYFSVMVMGPEAVKHPGHGPHIHDDAELLVALGTDMENPRDLARLDNPQLALEDLEGLIVIDEIQRKPNLFPLIGYMIVSVVSHLI